MGGAASKSTYSPVIFPTSPAPVVVRNANSKETTTSNLRKVVEERCPTLLRDFVPAWWMNNGHLQTLYCVVGDFTKSDQVYYNRYDETPIVVVLHGLTGGSHESYVRGILSKACAPIETGGLGYRGVVVNFRGCAGTPMTAQQLYSAGWTEDLRQALMYIAHRYPNAPLHGLGFSLGANVIVRYVGEEKEQSRLSSACALACPWDLAENNRAMENSFLGKYVYSKGMANNLLRLLRRHKDSLGKKPDHFVTEAMYNAFSLKSPTLEQFDNAFTCKAGGGPPIFPFKTSGDYYRWGSSHYLLPDVRVPLLTLNAMDDPVVQKVPTGVDNPSVVMAVTRGGGHLGWFEPSTEGWFDVKRWVTKPVLEWLRMVGNDLVVEKRVSKEIFVGVDGYIRERGSDDLGCKVVNGEVLIEGATKDEDLIQGL
ncbi:AB-hydrolase YheT [Hymenopellis radicata]|nr:AB-hydrolase YheT [Hymenopellis radicata]